MSIRSYQFYQQYRFYYIPIMKSKAEQLSLSSSRFSHKHISHSALELVQDIKRKHRPQLKLRDWDKCKYHLTDITARLLDSCPDQIERRDASSLSPQQFIKEFQQREQPVLIKGIAESWPASKQWQFQSLYDQFKQIKFKVGQDDDGTKLRIKLKYYLQYLIHNTDDSPLYLFESNLEERRQLKPLLDMYKVPPFFNDDLFSHTGQQHRPPFRWFLIGPERSGTTLHIDPLMTSAWNTSLKGYKRWVLFHPSLPKSLLKGMDYYQRGSHRQAIDYFSTALPKLIQAQGRQILKIRQFIQGPGETVFVPGGWWHAVINCTDTIAVTQNFMSRTNFLRVWNAVRVERPKFSHRLRRKLLQHSDEFKQFFEKDNSFLDNFFSCSSKSSSSSSSDEETPVNSRKQKRSRSTQLKSRQRSRQRPAKSKQI